MLINAVSRFIFQPTDNRLVGSRFIFRPTDSRLVGSRIIFQPTDSRLVGSRFIFQPTDLLIINLLTIGFIYNDFKFFTYYFCSQLQLYAT
jgi:hypothetical protein